MSAWYTCPQCDGAPSEIQGACSLCIGLGKVTDAMVEARAVALIEYGNSLPDGVTTEAFAEAANLRSLVAQRRLLHRDAESKLLHDYTQARCSVISEGSSSIDRDVRALRAEVEEYAETWDISSPDDDFWTTYIIT